MCATCLNALDSSGYCAYAAHSTTLSVKDPPSFVSTCTPQCLVVKVTCMQDFCTSISCVCIGQELPFQLSTVFLGTAWLDQKALALLPGFCIAVVPLLPVLKTWCFKVLPVCCHGCPKFMHKSISKSTEYHQSG